MMLLNNKSLIWVLVAVSICGIAVAGGFLAITAGAAESRSQTQIFKDVTPQEAYALIQKNKANQNFVILDVRTPKEFVNGHIEGAVNLDYNAPTFKDDLNGLDRAKAYLIYCRTARRSRGALDMMRAFEFQEVYHVLGGIVRWQAEGLPITK